MELGLRGKVAAVCGSSRGIGRAVAESLATEGAAISLCARDRDALEATADRVCQRYDVDVFSSVINLTTADGPQRFIEETVDRAGGLDILVANTGGPPVGTFVDLGDDAWVEAHEQLLLSTVRLIRAALPSMRQRGGGRVIIITSLSVKQPIPGLMLSTAYRAGVTGLAKTLAGELAPDGILVNTVCPGRISTERLADLDRLEATRRDVPLQQVRSEQQSRIPLGRYGQPNEIAALVTFLASSRGSYITGNTIQCDGGLHGGIV